MKTYTKSYTAEELAFFVRPEWVETRRARAPRECNGGRKCWVLYGPPAYDKHCLGCRSQPLPMEMDKWQKY